MNKNMMSEKSRLYHDICVIDFVIVEMTLYLDTHPTDQEAIGYVKHYVRMKNQSMQEYAHKYGPLSICSTDVCNSKEWEWALQPMPWEGVC